MFTCDRENLSILGNEWYFIAQTIVLKKPCLVDGIVHVAITGKYRSCHQWPLTYLFYVWPPNVANKCSYLLENSSYIFLFVVFCITSSVTTSLYLVFNRVKSFLSASISSIFAAICNDQGRNKCTLYRIFFSNKCMKYSDHINFNLYKILKKRSLKCNYNEASPQTSFW